MRGGKLPPTRKAGIEDAGMLAGDGRMAHRRKVMNEGPGERPQMSEEKECRREKKDED
jgi:ribosomal protein S9